MNTDKLDMYESHWSYWNAVILDKLGYKRTGHVGMEKDKICQDTHRLEMG